MKLEITGAFGLVAALGVCTLAAVAWSEPAPVVLSAENGRGYCPLPVAIHATQLRVSPDLLLLMFGLSQAKIQG